MELAARAQIHPHVGDVPGPGAELLLEEPGLRPAAPQLLDRGVEHAVDGQNLFGFESESDIHRHVAVLSKWSRRPRPPARPTKENGANTAAGHGGYEDEYVV